MVKILSREDHAAIKQAVSDAEANTDAELAVVVARASDEYRAIGFICGVALGCIAALLLWSFKLINDFPLLLLTELSVTALAYAVPAFRHLCLRLAPKRYLFHQAAQRAAGEYVHLTHHLPSSAPVVLIYVSLAERYVHIYSSRLVRESIPDSQWHAVVKTLTASMRSEGVRAAVIKAVEHASEMLKAKFPASGGKHASVLIREIS